MYPRNFHAESAALYRYRDALLGAYMDIVNSTPRGVTIVNGDVIHDPLPPMPDNLREALDAVNNQIARLVAEHHAIRERDYQEREYEQRRRATHG